MRYFDLRGLLPQPEAPSTVALPTFERIGNALPAEGLPTAIEAAPDRLAPVMSALESAGLGVDRHTCPDLLAQLRAAATSQVDNIVCTLLDGDATLRLNAALAARYPDELIAGLEFLDKLLAPKRSWIATDETAPPNWLAPFRAAARTGKRRVVALRNDYPESDPSLLLFTLLRRRLKPGRLPTDARALLVDAPAAVSLGRFAWTGRRPPDTWVAVHRSDWPSARYADVAPGTRLRDVLGHFGLRAPDHLIRAGDLLRDRKVDGDLPVGPGELTFHVAYPERATNPDPCVRCGWCIEGCPVRIHPAGILEAAQQGDVRLGRHYGLDSCIECGICSYVCPSRLPLLTGIRTLRAGGPP